MKPLCALRQQALSRYAALGAPLPDGSPLARHIARCDRCRAAWNDLRRLATDLPRTLTSPPLSARFDANLQSRLASVARRKGTLAPPMRGRGRRQAWGRSPGVLAAQRTAPGAGPRADGRRWGRVVQHRPLALAAAVLVILAMVGAVFVWLPHPSPVSNTIGQSQASAKRMAAANRGSAALERPVGRSRASAALPPRSIHSAPVPDSPRHPFPIGGLRRASTAHRPRTIPLATDDLASLNGEPPRALSGWAGIPRDEMAALETRLRHDLRRGDDFISVPLPRLAAAGPEGDRAAARAVAEYRREATIVDPRLFHTVSLALKATALSDLCDRLRTETGVSVAAGKSVADEKVTVFCKEMPLRDVMRRLARPFGYTWLRSAPHASPPPGPPDAEGKQREYRYELVQDLRSQLLEEELRNRDRNAALLALDQEMSAYRKYLNLSPEEAKARAQKAPPEEKKLLETLANRGWGPVQLYFRLSPNDLSTLRTGGTLTFSAASPQEQAGGAGPEVHIGAGMKFSLTPETIQQSLPPELARSVLQSLGDVRIANQPSGFRMGPAKSVPDGLPPVSVPEASARVTLRIDRSELGQLALEGGSGITLRSDAGGKHNSGQWMSSFNLAVGVSPSVHDPDNAAANARLAHDPALQERVTVHPVRSGSPSPPTPTPTPTPTRSPNDRVGVGVGVGVGAKGGDAEKVTTADVLEALYQATGIPIVADYYTRLYRPEEVSVQEMPLFEALNHLCRLMRLRWTKEGDWLEFRSASFYNDRLKEVPHRLLARWASSRREHGALMFEDLIEIDGLSEVQLDSNTMAEGARLLYGLEEWDVARNLNLRPHLRFLANFSPPQRQAVESATGLGFRELSLAQQQGFIALALGAQAERLHSLEDLADARMRVDYAVPAWFEWTPPKPDGASPASFGFQTPIRARTPEAALQAARQADPHAVASQVAPTELQVTIIHSLRDPATGHPMEIVRRAKNGGSFSMSTSVNNTPPPK